MSPFYFDMGPKELEERVELCQTIPPTLKNLYPDLDTSLFDKAVERFNAGLAEGLEVGKLRTLAQKVEEGLKAVLQIK